VPRGQTLAAAAPGCCQTADHLYIYKNVEQANKQLSVLDSVRKHVQAKKAKKEAAEPAGQSSFYRCRVAKIKHSITLEPKLQSDISTLAICVPHTIIV
jgi:hypothetical protein